MYLDTHTGTGTSEDVFNLLVIKGPTPGEGMQRLKTGSPDPQSSPPSLHHRGGKGGGVFVMEYFQQAIKSNKNLATKRVMIIVFT